LLPDNTRVKGTLQSAANTFFSLDFYANDAADATGHGEGQHWLGELGVTTDATGFVAFSVPLSGPSPFRFLSATATDPAGNTSEFSAARRAVTTAPPADFAVTTTADSGPGSLRQAILDANAALNEGDRIAFNIPGDGPHTISPATALPALAAPVTLDGYTQPGATANTLAEGFNATFKIILDGNTSPSSTDGLRLEAPRATVRGLVLNRWKGEGIEILATAGASVIEGNVIGLGLDSSDLGQNSHGVLVSGSAGNRIGGSAPAQRNVISGNGNHGIFLNGAGARDNLVHGNFLGTDLAGTARVVNNGDGVHVTAGSDNRIGGGASGEGNVIGGNNGEGVELENANGNVVQGNRIGVAFNGAEIRNAGNGVLLNNASDTVIGGVVAARGNVIARNSGRGITLLNNTSQRNLFRANSIFANGNLGIDLFNNGRTLNDPGDADTGPNGFQNFPELTGAITEAAATQVMGTFNGAASETFTLEFFASREADPTGFGEGEQFLGVAQVTTDADGNGAFNVSLPTRAVGRFITATATGPEGTSEFSAAVRATSTIAPLTFTVTTTADSGPGSLRQALLDADQAVTGPPHRIVFAIPGDGPHTIAPATPLPVLVNEPVEIDGFTQPGASPNTLAEGFNAVHRVVLDGTALPFNSLGLRFNTSGNIVRGLVLVNFRSNEAVLLQGNGNAVEGCLIGLGLDGSARPNFYGVRITGTATGNRVGGPTSAGRNVIAASLSANVRVDSSVGANRVQGNFIGLVPAGNAVPANTDTFSGTSAGILVQSSPDNLLGGAEPGAGNVVGGHFGAGIELREAGSARTRVLGNRIGTDATGRLPVPNTDGVWIVGGPGTVVGGPGAGEGNRIAFNRQHGVNINGFANKNDNRIRGNSITENLQLGINLGFDVVLENDAGDADDDANRGQNFPVLTTASAGNGSTTVQGTLNSVASKAYTLDFYANVACDGSGNGEGDQYLGSTTVSTGADGNGTFNVMLPVTVVGRFLTATATDPDGNTSEFCDCFEATTQFGSETFLVTNTNDAGAGSLRDALLRNNASVAGAANRIEFALPGDGPHVLTPATAWPAISHAVVMDGYSQPGARANTLANGSDAVLKIHLQAGSGFGGTGLELNTVGSLVRGLALTKWVTAIEVNGGQNTIQGCFIGLDPAGSNIGTLNGTGLRLASGNGHRIGGTAPGERNLIGGNGAGLTVFGNDAVIEGNWFGLDPTGRLPRGNAQPIQLSGNNHRFGGSDVAARNVVAATSADGLRLAGANNCLVALNFIGTDATGLAARGNLGIGLQVTGVSSGNEILGNVIGGNTGAGLQSAGGSVILGNRIGVGVDATTPLPNGQGISLHGSGNRVGGVAAGEANVIAHNLGDGVLVTGADTSGNAIRGNVITGNTGLGLNLGFDGVTPNDAGDADSGPNGLLNFPELTTATVNAASVEIAGTFDSRPERAFTLDFYANREADASGFGEGRQYLGSTTVNTGADGRATFNVNFNVIALGRWLTATATDLEENTSEFSRALRANTTRPGGTFTVTSAADSGPGTLRQAILDASAVMAGTPHLIRFDLPAPLAPSIGRHANLPPGVRTIALQSALPVPEEMVTLDGFTQPGTAANAAEDRDDALRLIHLDGLGLGFGSAGLSLRLAGSSVRGLIITRVFNGPAVELAGEGQCVVAGCLLAGNQDGVVIRGSSGNRIGGAARGERNVIVEHTGVGVLITGEAPKENVVLGNFIGLDAGGEKPALNADGILVEAGASHRIGGLAAGEANWIAFNRLAGVYLRNGQGSVVRGNRIFANEGLGLDLGNRGVTANDAGDADVGANGLQNFPVLTAANVVAGGIRVTGTLNSAPGTAYELDFHHNAFCDSTGHGEGALHFGSLTVTTDAAGNASFDAVLPARIPRGSITATATGPGGTSEFSQCRVLGTELPAATFLVTTTADDGPGSLRQAIRDANAAFTSARNTIAFNLPGTGVQLIQPLSPLPDFTQAVDVEGYTQPGAAPATLAEKLNHKILVHLDGEKAGAGTDGLTVAGSGISVRGLMVTRFAGRGLRVKPGGNVSLGESWMGTAGGTAAGPNGGPARQATPDPFALGNGGGGIFADQSQFTIDNSVIAGNPGNGVEGQNALVFIHNTFIGPGPGDDSLLGNGGNGVDTLRGSLNIFNSTISGNDDFGVSANGGGLFGGGSHPVTIRDSTISENGGAGNGNGGGIFIAGNGLGAPIQNGTLANNHINGNDGPGLELHSLGGADIIGNTFTGNTGTAIRLNGVTDTLIGANPNAPAADDMNVIKGNGGGGVVAVDVFGVSILFNVISQNNLPVNISESAPSTPLVEVNPATREITVRSNVEVFPPQQSGEASLVIFNPVPGVPGCVQPGPTLQAEVAENGDVRFVVPLGMFGNGVAVAVGDFKGDGSTAVTVNPSQPSVDVVVDKSFPENTPIRVGDIVEFTVSATVHPGQSSDPTGYQVLLRDRLPVAFSYVSSEVRSPSGDAVEDFQKPVVRVVRDPFLGDLVEIEGRVGQPIGRDMTVVIRARADLPGTFNNRVELARTDGFTDTNPSNNSAEVTVVVQGNELPADLSVVGPPFTGDFTPGTPFNFTVQIQNGGPNAGQGTVLISFPVGTAVTQSPDDCQLIRGNVAWLHGVYRKLFGRTPGLTEEQAALKELQTVNREAVVERLLNSAEYRTQMIRELYQTMLQRDPDFEEVDVALGSSDLPEVVRHILADQVLPQGGPQDVVKIVETTGILGSGGQAGTGDDGFSLPTEFDLSAYLQEKVTPVWVQHLVPSLTATELANLPEAVIYRCELPELANGATATKTFQVNPLHPGVFVLRAEIRGQQPDPVPENNLIFRPFRVVGAQDLGDAPALGMNPPLLAGIGGTYPVRRADNGARHEVDPSVGLGTLTDAEADGQPDTYGRGDDGAGGDDEDGVLFASPQVVVVPAVGGPTPVPAVVAPAVGRAGDEVRLAVKVRAPAGKTVRLSAWVDFNRDGDWADAGEQVIANRVVAAGVRQFRFTLPAGMATGLSFARFRLSSDETPLPPEGSAPDGEVEDHLILLGPLERGDAPALYGAAPHLIPPNPVAFLGLTLDEDPVQPSGDARADDTDADGDDEDGVTEIGPFFAGVVSSLVVTASEAGFVDLWLDYNGVNGFEANPAAPDPTEYVNSSIVGLPAGAVPAPFPVVKGPNVIRFRVPDRLKGGLSFLRVRYTTQAIPGLGPVNLAPDGEVEDYRVQLYPLAPDFGDAPDSRDVPQYPTLRANNGAFHLVTEDRFFLGLRVDIEPDGFPSLDALGDDQNDGLETPPNPDPDDEDGVQFLTPLTPGQPASVQLVVTAQNPGPAFVNAWVDFNGDFDWADPGEQVLVNVAVVNGTNVVNIAVPASARPGNTYARFRLTRDQGIGFAGPATSGEVEDYLVAIAEPAGELRIGSVVQVGDAVELRWDGGAGVHLESAPTVNGPWSTVLGATSPFRANPGAAGAADGQFYRLVR